MRKLDAFRIDTPGREFMPIADPVHLAGSLHAQLRRRHHRWLATVGSAGDSLVLVATRMPDQHERASVPATFGGLPVSIRYARDAEAR